MSEKFKSNHNKFKQKQAKTLYSRFPRESKRKRELEKQSYLEALSNNLNLPADILAGAPILTVTGNNQLRLENYKGIIEYTGALIRVQTKTGRMQIEGASLMIDYFTDDEMVVSGRIHSINFT